jgi:hypothetical protein
LFRFKKIKIVGFEYYLDLKSSNFENRKNRKGKIKNPDRIQKKSKKRKRRTIGELNIKNKHKKLKIE